MHEQQDLAGSFEQHRARMRSLAYRMLGSVSEAEDAVQDAWLRLSRVDADTKADAIDNLGGWLTTVVTRICLNYLRARSTRGEEPLDWHVPDPLIEAAAHNDPERQAVIADSVGLALLVVLDTLTPGERLAFVLHDMFDLPFEQIAPLVERSPEATRQLASRARRRVRGGPAPDRDPALQRRVVDAFFAAARAGDFDELVGMLDPGVILRADAGAGRPELSVLLRGPAAVAKRALMFARPDAELLPATIGDSAGTVVIVGDRPVSVMSFTVVAGSITEINALVDPGRLARLDISALARG